MNNQLSSEQIVVQAPMSFAGSMKRIWKLTYDRDSARAGWITLAVTLIALAWFVVLCWYLTFGLFVVPYRLIRRSSRNRKLADARHREMMAMMSSNQVAAPGLAGQVAAQQAPPPEPPATGQIPPQA